MKLLRASLPERGNEARKIVARSLLDSLTEMSPVDTGRFVSNWQVGRQVGREIEPYAEGAAGSTRQANVEAARAVGREEINATRPGEPLVIFNATSYGRYLDEGSSTRPALSFVARSILLANLVLQAAKGLFDG